MEALPLPIIHDENSIAKLAGDMGVNCFKKIVSVIVQLNLNEYDF